MTREELDDVLAAHRAWLHGDEGGVRADLSGVNLRNADLREADLSYADLREADLWNVVGNMRELLSLHTDTWPIAISRSPDGCVVQIGCQRHDWREWLAFQDDTISLMDEKALDWWRVWKPVIAAVIAAKGWDERS